MVKRHVQSMGKRIKKLAYGHWYGLSIAAFCLVVVLLVQPWFPLIAEEKWEDWAESLYTTALNWRDVPQAEGEPTVAVIELDQRTHDELGWPLDRAYYGQLLEHLQANGHPWILSRLYLASTDASTKEEAEKKETEPSYSADNSLAEKISTYGRFIGSGMSFDEESGASLPFDHEDELIDRMLLSNLGDQLVDFPTFEISLKEDPAIVVAQHTSSMPALFSPDGVPRCVTCVLEDSTRSGNYVFAASTLWAASLAQKIGLQSSTGARYPRHPQAVVMNVSRQHCMAYPGVDQETYNKRRGIEKFSFVDVLKDRANLDFTNKVVILASDQTPVHEGPRGLFDTSGAKLFKQHQFTARLVDSLIRGESIRREPLSTQWHYGWLAILIAVLLTAGTWFSLSFTYTLLLAGTTGLLAYSTRALLQSEFSIPMHGLMVCTAYLAFIPSLAVLRRVIHGIRWHQFNQELEYKLGSAQDLHALELAIKECCQKEFLGVADLMLSAEDEYLYLASADPEKAHNIITEFSKMGPSAPPSTERMVSIAHPTRRFGIRNNLFINRYEVELPASLGEKFLGHLQVTLTHNKHQHELVQDLLESLHAELITHWQRIRALIDKKILDYQVVMERTRTEIMSRFMCQALVDRFQNNRTMAENLQTLLTSRPGKAAMLQADIRGYSQVSRHMAPSEMVTLLQGYYSATVDEAQKWAQVKLIGDCIFLFIEETPTINPVDVAMSLAATLAKEAHSRIDEQVAEGKEPMYFGIAINYGDVVIGNLSSDQCIDYTVIGPNVNLAARLEEFTKQPVINSALGPNGLLLSPDALAASSCAQKIKTHKFDLAEHQLEVRSFPDIKSIYGIKSEDLISYFEGQTKVA